MCFCLIFALPLKKGYDFVAQLVEQYTFNVWVLGSSPSEITRVVSLHFNAPVTSMFTGVCVWSQQGSKLTGSGSIGNSFNGRSVSISADGKIVITGGYLDNSNIGAAWIFTIGCINNIWQGSVSNSWENPSNWLWCSSGCKHRCYYQQRNCGIKFKHNSEKYIG